MAEVHPSTVEKVGSLVTGDLASTISKELLNQKNIRLVCKSWRNVWDASQVTLAAGRCIGWDSFNTYKLSSCEPTNRAYVREAVQRGCRPASFLLRGKSYTKQQRSNADLHNDGPAAHAARMLQLVQSIPGALPPGSSPLPTTHLEIHSALLTAGPAMAHAIAAAFPNLTHITLLAADVRANVLITARADAPAISECLLHLLSSNPPPPPPPLPASPPPANPYAGDARDTDGAVPLAALNAAAAPPAAPPAVPHAGPLLPHLTSLTVDAAGGFPPMLHTALLAATHVRELRCCSYDPSLEQPYDQNDDDLFEAVTMLMLRPPDNQLEQMTELRHLTSLHLNAKYLWNEAVALLGTLTTYLPGLQRLELPAFMGDLCVNDFAGLVHLHHLAVPWQILGTQGLAAAGPLQHLTSLEVRALGTRQQNSAQEAALLGAAEEAGGVGGGGGAAGAAGGAAAPILPSLQRLVLNEARLQSPVALARLWGHTSLRQLTMWTGNGPYRGLDDQLLAPFGEQERAAAMKAQGEEDRAGGLGGVPTLAFLHWEVWHGRLTAVGEVALGRCAELLAGVQQKAGGGTYREIELKVQRGRQRRDDDDEEEREEVEEEATEEEEVEEGEETEEEEEEEEEETEDEEAVAEEKEVEAPPRAVAPLVGQELKALRLDGYLFPTASKEEVEESEEEDDLESEEEEETEEESEEEEETEEESLEEEAPSRAVAPLVGRHAGWLSRLSGLWGLARLQLRGLELVDGDLQAMAAGLQELKALRLDGCLFPTASLPVLAALPRLHTLTLDVGCWWSHSLWRSRPGPSGLGAAILLQSEMLGRIRGEDQLEDDLGAPLRGPVPTSDPQFLLHEAPWQLANLCVKADQLQRVGLWVAEELEVRDVEAPKAAVEAVCRRAEQLRLQAVELRSSGPAEAGTAVVHWARPEDA